MNTIRNLFKSPEQKAAEEFVQCRQEMSSLPTGSMGSKLVKALGGDEAFCSLPKLAWERSFGPSRWMPSEDLCYDVPSEKMSAPVMRGTNSQGAPVVILRKECNVTSHRGFTLPPKQYSFVTTEVISPKFGNTGFSEPLMSTHFHVDKTPPIYPRNFEYRNVKELPKLLAGETLRFDNSSLLVNSKLV